MEVELSKTLYDHQDGSREEISRAKSFAILNPYGGDTGDKVSVFAIGVIFAGERFNRDKPHIQSRFPLGVIDTPLDFAVFTKGVQETVFTVVRMMRKAEYVAIHPDYVNGAARDLYPAGKKVMMYNAVKFCPDIHKFTMTESLRCKVVCVIYTRIPTTLTIWKPMYFKKVEKHPLIAMKLIVEMSLGSLTGHDSTTSTVQIPLGWRVGKGLLKEDMLEALRVIKNANPKVSLGAIHGISLHVILMGEIAPAIKFYTKGKSHIVMSMADTCPAVNFHLCLGRMRITRVSACATPIQPSTAILVNSAIEELEEAAEAGPVAILKRSTKGKKR